MFCAKLTTCGPTGEGSLRQAPCPIIPPHQQTFRCEPWQKEQEPLIRI